MDTTSNFFNDDNSNRLRLHLTIKEIYDFIEKFKKSDILIKLITTNLSEIIERSKDSACYIRNPYFGICHELDIKFVNFEEILRNLHIKEEIKIILTEQLLECKSIYEDAKKSFIITNKSLRTVNEKNEFIEFCFKSWE